MTHALDSETLETLGRGFDSRPERSLSLHVDCYRDPKILAAERDSIFYRSWQFLCHEEKLRDTGAYVASEIQERSFFAVRDKGGALRAFYNVCKHRAHQLLQGEGKTRLITCPYHAWTYDLDGSLRTARHSDDLENFDKADFCLTAIRIEVFCSLVFVNFDPDARPLAEQSGALGQEIAHYAPDLEHLTFAKRLTYSLKANWKAVVDNFLECNHCPVAHKDFCTLVEMESYKVTTHDIYSSHMAKAGRAVNTAYAVEDASVTDHSVWYLWPNTTLLRYPGRGNFMVWRFIPVGPEETYEIFDFFFETAEPNEVEVAAIDYIDRILQREDIDLVESVQRGMQTGAFTQGRYIINKASSGLSEHAVHHFHGLVLEAYGQAIQSEG